MDAETSIAITNCRSTPTGSPAAGDRSAASAAAATTIRQPSAGLPARFTSLPANDGELGPIEAFRLHPCAALAGQIGPVEPLGERSFRALLTRRLREGFAATAYWSNRHFTLLECAGALRQTK